MRWIMTIFCLVLAYFLFWPLDTDPQAWKPRPDPGLGGVFSPTGGLRAEQLLGDMLAPEGLALDPEGRVCTGAADGSVHRLDALESTLLARLPGRPLGLCFGPEGSLYVCLGDKGLWVVPPGSEPRQLCAEADGLPVRFANACAMGPQGRIWFTDSSRLPPERILDAFLEQSPHGRIISCDPRTGESRTEVDGLFFANGLAFCPAGDSLLICETDRYRVLRRWISGPNQGRTDIFIDNLPGYPDNLSRTADGFWLALVSRRDQLLDETLLPRPWLRRMVLRLPHALLPGPEPESVVMRLDGQGRVMACLSGSPESYGGVTSVLEHDGRLYLGSRMERGVGVLTVNREQSP
ncbi:MAG: SMP-30/gluconolactonase/LRE family protein [Desulfovibrionaceae bacterium]